LDVGCGTGYTACLLAKKYQVDVVAAGTSPTVLEEAKKRIAREKVSNKVKAVEADAHALPFPQNTFDAVLAESVLVFCEKIIRPSVGPNNSGKTSVLKFFDQLTSKRQPETAKTLGGFGLRAAIY
jgi:SAM-dependent methyltransferase